MLSAPTLIRRIFFTQSLIILCLGMNARAQTNFSIYSDQLDNGFQNWSWGANNFSSTSPVHAGANAVLFTGNTYDGISFEHSDFNPAPYTNLTFWANGGSTGGQVLQLTVQFGASSGPNYLLPPLPTNSWRQFNLSFSTLGVAGVTNFNRLNFQLTASGKAGSFSLDDVGLVATRPASVHISVNARQTLRTADARWFGLNTAVWDNYFDTTYTSNALRELGTLILRFPGGSLSDDYHWATGTTGTNTWTWATSFKNFVHVATNAATQGMITVNYGAGTPQEAAAWVRYANITNHFNFKNWEVGNECYGGWENDTNASPHDPYTYAFRAAQYITQMRAADASIKIGVPVVPGEDNYDNGYTAHSATNSRTGTTHYGWTPIVLATLKSLGVTPDFLVHHVYPEYQTDSDQGLLLAAANWAGDAANLRQQINDYFGTGGTNIELLCTENNADSDNGGKQSTSLVNGLYLADSLAQLMKTEINGFIWWDLRNGANTSGADFDPSLFGWRTNGDLGIIGDTNTRYPVFYTFKLMQYLARPGDTVLNAGSDYLLLPAYATRKADGALALLVINKDRTANQAAQITLTNFFPWSTATVRSYGIAQDEATRTNGLMAAQDLALTNFTSASTNFPTAFPPYSLTLFTFAPAAPRMQTMAMTGGKFTLQLQGQPGVPYQIQTSTNLLSWTSNATVTLSNATWNVTNSLTAGAKFWRAVWLP